MLPWREDTEEENEDQGHTQTELPQVSTDSAETSRG